MSLEQELVRLFGTFARKAAGYQIPYSACTVITSQMRPLEMKVCCDSSCALNKLPLSEILKLSNMPQHLQDYKNRHVTFIHFMTTVKQNDSIKEGPFVHA